MPKRKSKSPKRKSRTPKRKSRTPKRKSRTPKRKSKSPKRKSRTPKRKSRSPKRKSKSPNRSKRKSKSPTYKKSEKLIPPNLYKIYEHRIRELWKNVEEGKLSKEKVEQKIANITHQYEVEKSKILVENEKDVEKIIFNLTEKYKSEQLEKERQLEEKSKEQIEQIKQIESLLKSNKELLEKTELDTAEYKRIIADLQRESNIPLSDDEKIRLSLEITAKEEQILKKEQEKLELENLIQSIREEQVLKSQEFNDTQDKLNQFAQEVMELNERNEELRKRNEDLEEGAMASSAEAMALNEKNEDLEAGAMASSAEATELRKRNDYLELELQSKKVEEDASMDNIMKEEFKDTQDELNQFARRVKELNERNEELQAKLQTEKVEKYANDVEKNMLKQKLANQSKELETTPSNCEETERKLATLQKLLEKEPVCNAILKNLNLHSMSLDQKEAKIKYLIQQLMDGIEMDVNGSIEDQIENLDKAIRLDDEYILREETQRNDWITANSELNRAAYERILKFVPPANVLNSRIMLMTRRHKLTLFLSNKNPDRQRECKELATYIAGAPLMLQNSIEVPLNIHLSDFKGSLGSIEKIPLYELRALVYFFGHVTIAGTNIEEKEEVREKIYLQAIKKSDKPNPEDKKVEDLYTTLDPPEYETIVEPQVVEGEVVKEEVIKEAKPVTEKHRPLQRRATAPAKLGFLAEIQKKAKPPTLTFETSTTEFEVDAPPTSVGSNSNSLMMALSDALKKRNTEKS